jgi:hypothetical protein
VRRLCTQPPDTELYLCGVERGRGRGREREREGGRNAQFLQSVGRTETRKTPGGSQTWREAHALSTTRRKFLGLIAQVELGVRLRPCKP